MIGISIKPGIGVGDGLQFSSLPENYFRATGEKLLDVSRPWFFDNNPYVDRSGETPTKTVEMWNYSPTQYEWPIPRKERPQVYLSNAEIWAAVFDVPCVLNRPRLYAFEDFPYWLRNMVLLHTSGRSHGEMPRHIIDHVKAKYGPQNLFLVGSYNDPINDYGIPEMKTKTLWDFAWLVSRSRMFIGVDSGPSWVAECYPDVIVKKVRTKPNPPEELEKWIPLEIRNIHSHWDDRAHQVFNVTEDDIGFTYSYKRL